MPMFVAIYHRRFTLDRVIDGDTVVGTVDNGYYTTIKQTFRLHGINTPEMNSPDPAVRDKARAARDFLCLALGFPGDATALIIRTYKNPADKYGRFLAEIWTTPVQPKDSKGLILADEKSVNRLMVEAGHAVEYLP
jgi:endonuclease YncB( thermonuclease family)